MAGPVHTIDTPALRRARMQSLLLGSSGAGGRDVTAVVRWFGALQGQDAASIEWSLGVRTAATRTDVAAALESGKVLRTWPMRGTLHLIPAQDARWMLHHLGGRSLRKAGARRAALGLDAAQADRAAEALGQALSGGLVLTRAECVAALRDAGIDTDGQRAYHLLWYAAATGVTCVGPTRDRQQTFALLDDWAPDQVDLDRADALATIAGRFIRSHGPATAHDLARWADLTMADARAGLAQVPGLVRVSNEGVDLVATQECLDRAADSVPARALPGFDELVLGYRDRSAQLDRDHEQRVVPGRNGMFAPTLVVAGRVVGTWHRTPLARHVRITPEPFGPTSAADRAALSEALQAYAEHLGMPAQITWPA